MYHLTKESSNVKIGKMPVTTSSKKFCPNNCPFKGNGCYAENFPLSLHWGKVTSGERGTNIFDHCKQIASLPHDSLYRINQAGDLTGDGILIDKKALNMMIRANRFKRGFTYTHYDIISHTHNFDCVKRANRLGLTVNVSANNLNHADILKEMGLPVVVTIPGTTLKQFKTPAGNNVIVCPAITGKKENCKACSLCQKSNRKSIIAFPVHGTKKSIALTACLN